MKSTLFIKKRNVVESDEQVKLPFFSTDGIDFYKVTGENECVQVRIFKSINEYGINKKDTYKAFESGNTQCTEQEFQEAYDLALSHIIDIVQKGCGWKEADAIVDDVCETIKSIAS